MTEFSKFSPANEVQSTIEQRANVLTSFLTRFANSDTETREGMIARMKLYLMENATMNVLEILSADEKRNQQLAQVMEAVFQNTSEGSQLWTDSGTVVVIGREGSILGFHGVQPKNMSHYGGEFNFFGPALGKALACLHLDKAGMQGGLGNNSEYLQRIGFGWHEGSLGSPARLPDGREVFVGGSGCEVNPKFNEEIPDPDGEGHFRLAGFWDGKFVEQVIRQFVDPSDEREVGLITITEKVISDPFNN